MARLITLIFCSIFLGSITASAHHALTAYNRTTSKTVDGVVKDFRFVNPHARLILLVADSKGAMKEWDFEGGSIRRLTDRGFTAKTIAKGDKVKVAYNPMRDGKTGGFFLGVTTPTGKYYGTQQR
jgi:hypothetical protein